MYLASSIAALVLALAAVADDPHAANDLYKELTTKGVAVGPKLSVPIRGPIVADGLNAAGQKKAIADVLSEAPAYDDFVRKSPVAPHWLKMDEVKSDDPGQTIHAIDAGFIAYGSLSAFADRDFRAQLFKSRSDSKSQVLTDDALAKRGLKLKKAERYEESFTFAEFEVLEKVQLRGTNRTVLTAAEESVVMASRVEPAFTGDPEFPNQWRPVERTPEGTAKLGPPADYAAYGWYMKATRLHDPAGALFIEFHLVHAEPKGWFGGANLLRSKVPVTTQTEVRALRRELGKVK
jgi:hypothetical protein